MFTSRLVALAFSLLALVVINGCSCSGGKGDKDDRDRRLAQIADEERARVRAADDEKHKLQKEQDDRDRQRQAQRDADDDARRKKEARRKADAAKLKRMADSIGKSAVSCYHPTATYTSTELLQPDANFDFDSGHVTFPLKVSFTGALTGNSYYMNVDVNVRMVEGNFEIQVPPAGVDTAPFPPSANCRLRSWTPISE